MTNKDLFSEKRVEAEGSEGGAGLAGDDKHEFLDEELKDIAGGVDVEISDQLKLPGRYRVKGKIAN